MHLLIVEDEKSLADIVKKGLEEEGYAVDIAYDGEEGLFMAENEPSDLIILDIMLPGIDGMTLLIPICNQVDTVIYTRHGGMPWRDKIKSVSKTFKGPSNCVTKRRR